MSFHHRRNEATANDRRVVVTPDVDPRFVASHVIDPVGNRLARRVLGKVVHQRLLRLALGLPLPTSNSR